MKYCLSTRVGQQEIKSNSAVSFSYGFTIFYGKNIKYFNKRSSFYVTFLISAGCHERDKAKLEVKKILPFEHIIHKHLSNLSVENHAK